MARLDEARRKKQVADSLEYAENVPRTDVAGSPSQEFSADPAPARHAPATESQRVEEKSKYESSTQFRAPKGDRFS